MPYVLLAQAVTINNQLIKVKRRGFKEERFGEEGIREGEIGEGGCEGIILWISLTSLTLRFTVTLANALLNIGLNGKL